MDVPPRPGYEHKAAAAQDHGLPIVTSDEDGLGIFVLELTSSRRLLTRQKLVVHGLAHD
jgi:hypothetical protein